MRTRMVVVALAAALAGGCGSDNARVTGRLVENGQPKTFPASTYAVVLIPVGPGGKPELTRSFTAVVEADGTFQVVASGGELPPGTYEVTVQGRGPSTAQPVSARRELKPGRNEVVIDLAKPTE